MKFDTILILEDKIEESTKFISQKIGKHTIVHEKEIELYNNLFSTLSELYYFKQLFDKRLTEILSNGKPELEHYLKEIQTLKSDDEIRIELTDIILSSSIKSFLVFYKSALDKTIILFNFRFNNKKKTFENRGKSFKKYIESNFEASKREKLLQLLDKYKKNNLDTVLNLRDNFVHNSDLAQYHHFHIFTTNDNSKVSSINDFIRPEFWINDNRYDAQLFLKNEFDILVEFIGEVLKDIRI